MMNPLSEYKNNAKQLLAKHNLSFIGDPKLEWSYEDRIFLWSVPSEYNHTHKTFKDAPGLWVINGDCPSDYLLLQMVKNKHEALVLFAQRYGYVARALSEGVIPEIIANDNSSDPLQDSQLSKKLLRYSALLFGLTGSGGVK